MEIIRDELLNDTCWVYVQQDTTGAYIIGITYDEDFYVREGSEGRKPLLWRRFEDTFAAAGYRMLLKKLSDEQLKKIIREVKKQDPNKLI